MLCEIQRDIYKQPPENKESKCEVSYRLPPPKPPFCPFISGALPPF